VVFFLADFFFLVAALACLPAVDGLAFLLLRFFLTGASVCLLAVLLLMMCECGPLVAETGGIIPNIVANFKLCVTGRI